MAGLQALTRRIKSVKSTRKVTRAMQMVSAAKMRKAQQTAITSRNYSQLAWQLIAELNPQMVAKHPLLSTNSDAQKIGVIIISTNKGLVGSLNTNLLYKLKHLEQNEIEVIHEYLIMGKKIKEAVSRLRKNLVADFEKQEAHSSPEEVYPLAHLITGEYRKQTYKKVYLIYNKFISTLNQEPVIQQLLPIEPDINLKPKSENLEFLFEPNPEAVLNHLLPRIIESQIYQAILESDASEHSARMIMMKNATEAAGDLISDLTLTFNQLRQGKITTELSEITAGKLALENK